MSIVVKCPKPTIFRSIEPLLSISCLCIVTGSMLGYILAQLIRLEPVARYEPQVETRLTKGYFLFTDNPKYLIDRRSASRFRYIP